MNKLCPLTERLKKVAESVPKCSLLADIGTDHAYIPIYLVQKGITKAAIASDVAFGPAKRAAENIANYGLSDKIKVNISSGLENINGADVIIIAGMGGKLIGDIITDGISTAKNADFLVLQPMTAVYELRRFLHDNGFIITKDTIAKEEDKLYNVLVAVKGSEQYTEDIYYHIGKIEIEDNDALLGEFIAKKVHAFDVMIENMANSSDPSAAVKRSEIISLKEQYIKVGEYVANRK